MNCQTCCQAIRRGEKTDIFDSRTFHEDPRDCVKATARRCAEISTTTGLFQIADTIRKEFELKGRK